MSSVMDKVKRRPPCYQKMHYSPPQYFSIPWLLAAVVNLGGGRWGKGEGVSIGLWRASFWAKGFLLLLLRVDQGYGVWVGFRCRSTHGWDWVPLEESRRVLSLLEPRRCRPPLSRSRSPPPSERREFWRLRAPEGWEDSCPFFSSDVNNGTKGQCWLIYQHTCIDIDISLSCSAKSHYISYLSMSRKHKTSSSH